MFTATMLAAQSIQLGISVVVAGGMESMSKAPKYIAEASLLTQIFRASTHDSTMIIQKRISVWKRYSSSLVDGTLKDGLWDVYNDYAMGMCSELCADHHSITREDQVEVSAGRGKTLVIIDKDESLEKFDPVKL
ncbi:hypothetical protein C4D60_Mb07t11770 [Musa balbisiana]|uniref:Thiolase N-terminal domain-containing protein n=1 Tax=Musa balbisiana TaxID=52838 RepID=A0A4S8JF87_MUSBA|nr:hypothetical protein C4D60_Mb07t11770 [Musa balbisiana]